MIPAAAEVVSAVVDVRPQRTAGNDSDSKASAAIIGWSAWLHRRAGDFGAVGDDLPATSSDGRREPSRYAPDGPLTRWFLVLSQT